MRGSIYRCKRNWQGLTPFSGHRGQPPTPDFAIAAALPEAYLSVVKTGSASSTPRLLLATAALLSCQLAACGQTKLIRLRNELISTPPAGHAPASRLPPPASSLFLLQFEGHPEAGSRAALLAAGVRLLKYVPDDAFIARFEGVTPDTIRAMGFIRYVGPYRPEHKLHPRLAAAARQAEAANQDLDLSVLCAAKSAPAEMAQARSLFSLLHHETVLRQGAFLRGLLPASRLAALSQNDAVLWVEPAGKRKLVDEPATKLIGGDDGQVATFAVCQQMGFAGAGLTVCVCDTGLDTGNTNTMHPDVRGRVSGFLPFPPLTDGSDGYGHGTHCAGIAAGNAATGETDPDTGAWYGLGIAPKVELFIERIFDADANEVYPPPSDAQIAMYAVRNGAQIGSHSWGNDVQGEYDTDAAQFDELARDADPVTPGDQPYLLEFSAGNAGSDYQTLDSPATGKNVIATGASENVTSTIAETYDLYADGPDTVADFSSRGPCADGRIKPDLVAPGTWIASMASSAAADESAIAWSVIDNYYVYMGGTSMSGPFAAGAGAVFAQYYKAYHTNAMPSPALIKAALINSAAELDESNGGPGPIPNNDEGWGRITLTNIIITNILGNPRYFQFLDQTVLLTQGEVYQQHALVQASDVPLKITLAYTDPPGFPGASPALVNNLDLQLIGPDGTIYLGNQFLAGESVPNATTADALNNVEGINVSQPAPGDYLVRVVATSIVEDARLDTAAIDQDFALVVSGDLARPGAGAVLLDRSEYTAPSAIQLQVLDPARAGSNSVSVLLKSTTESAGAAVTLHASGNYGAFTGAVATVIGAPASGQLEIHNGDLITASYLDSSGVQRTAQAAAQLTPPSLTSVATTVDLGVVTITWQTSEPADSIVYYGTNRSSLNLAVTNAMLTTSHSQRLFNLASGKTYYFFVSSIDVAGNAGTNNSSGADYSFVAVSAPTVLLVDAYDTAAEEQNGVTVIPDSAYTNALVASGFSFAFWKVNDRGSPQLSDLQPFDVVIWRTTDDILYYGPDASLDALGLGDTSNQTNNTLTVQQQVMIQNYLNGGGAFFMSSMGILSQLGDVPFRQQVPQIAGFIENPDPPSPCDCDEYFGVPIAVGAPGDPISSGMVLDLDYSEYPSLDLYGDGSVVYGPDFSDTFTPTTNATAIFFESVSGKPCGLRYPKVGVDSPGRVVFLGFPIDTVPYSGAAPDNEVTVLKNALNFLVPGANGVGTILLDNSLYTVPSQVTVEVGDTDLIGQGQTQVIFSNSASHAEVTITALATSHPGLFRGHLSLVSSITGGATNQLAAANGATITASYFDASNNRYVTATATVDTVPPVITQVAATTDYSDATITWLTSKLADSAVQYGSTTDLGSSAYSVLLTTNHSVTISGLQADRTYYYRVLSRDAAGNLATNDNHGALFTFSTLQAIRPPWSDNFETGAPGWSVVPDPGGTDSNWTLGTPQNGLENQAHSGTNCWGSNLDGGDYTPDGWASTYLFSPVFDLSGLSQATLTFWDAFDFSVNSTLGMPTEDGQILLSTNSAADLSSLPVLVDYSGLSAPTWEQETVDLTPYVGQTVQIVWYYYGIDLNAFLPGSGPPPYGWLVDDVALTGVAYGQSATIIVNKNLSQGAFSLVGPVLNLVGTAPSTIITNAPPGTYTVQFGDVAFWNTPVSQTSNLLSGATLTFSGTYTFTDSAHNGMSDAWQMYYFGEVTTNRTKLTDTDHDGMTDYAEFIAGTDPTNWFSKLIFTSVKPSTNHTAQIQWAAVPGRMYQVQTSTNLTTWTPISDWMQTTFSPMTFIATNAVDRIRFFRVQVLP